MTTTKNLSLKAKATYFKVRPDVIELEPGFNLREEGAELTEHIERLYHAMKAGAYIPPIDVSVIGDRVLVRDGHCRTRAALRLLQEGVEYLLEARQLRGNDSDAVFHMLGSGQGKHFTPLEQGRGFLRLTNMGHTVAEIAACTGMHRSTVENGLALAEAPVAVQKTVRKVGKKKATVKHIDGPKEKEKPIVTRRVVSMGQTVETSTMNASQVADLVAQAQILVGKNSDDTFGEKCVEFVRTVAAKSTLVTYQSRDMVQLIETAFDITEPEGKKK